uniref:L1 transposable element RRM domain-containing protein n=1 Tax=Monodon monoceros TaxID=40151 RepID=A0A8C6BD19_MONMO
MHQKKEQDKTPEKQLNEVEIGNLPEKEFRIKRKMQEMFKKNLEELKNKQTEMNNTITEMKTTLEGINSRITAAEEQISDLEDRMVEFTALEQNKEKRMKRNEDSLRDIWDNIKHNNIRIIGVPEGEEREKGPEKILEEIIVENFPNMGKEIVTQVQEAQRLPYRINPRRNTLRHIVIKLAKIKDKQKLLKAEKQQITYKGILIKLTADLSAETLQARREWHDILKVMKGKNLQPRLLYLKQAKAKRIQHHQTSFTTNAKGTSLGRKHKGTKRPTITNPKPLRKW